MDPHSLKTVNAERRARRAVILMTDMRAGVDRIVRENEADTIGGELGEAVRNAFHTGVSQTVNVGEKSCFLNVYMPQPRLVVIGAVHISQALAPMAKIAGYPVEIIDPRTAFASAERFPDTEFSAEWPEDALKMRPLDPYCALAAVTHDPKIDDFALKAALDAGCFYVGALGSRKTHAKRVERLLATGVPADQIERIHAPIGVNIGALTPAEIAVSILAQVVEAFRSRRRALREAAA